MTTRLDQIAALLLKALAMPEPPPEPAKPVRATTARRVRKPLAGGQ